MENSSTLGVNLYIYRRTRSVGGGRRYLFGASFHGIKISSPSFTKCKPFEIYKGSLNETGWAALLRPFQGFGRLTCDWRSRDQFLTSRNVTKTGSVPYDWNFDILSEVLRTHKTVEFLR